MSERTLNSFIIIFLKFYNDIFFPTLEKEGITTIVDMGDTFDSRKGIDFSALSWAKE